MPPAIVGLTARPRAPHFVNHLASSLRVLAAVGQSWGRSFVPRREHSLRCRPVLLAWRAALLRLRRAGSGAIAHDGGTHLASYRTRHDSPRFAPGYRTRPKRRGPRLRQSRGGCRTRRKEQGRAGARPHVWTNGKVARWGSPKNAFGCPNKIQPRFPIGDKERAIMRARPHQVGTASEHRVANGRTANAAGRAPSLHRHSSARMTTPGNAPGGAPDAVPAYEWRC